MASVVEYNSFCDKNCIIRKPADLKPEIFFEKDERGDYLFDFPIYKFKDGVLPSSYTVSNLSSRDLHLYFQLHKSENNTEIINQIKIPMETEKKLRNTLELNAFSRIIMSEVDLISFSNNFFFPTRELSPIEHIIISVIYSYKQTIKNGFYGGSDSLTKYKGKKNFFLLMRWIFSKNKDIRIADLFNLHRLQDISGIFDSDREIKCINKESQFFPIFSEFIREDAFVNGQGDVGYKTDRNNAFPIAMLLQWIKSQTGIQAMEFFSLLTRLNNYGLISVINGGIYVPKNAMGFNGNLANKFTKYQEDNSHTNAWKFFYAFYKKRNLLCPRCKSKFFFEKNGAACPKCSLSISNRFGNLQLTKQEISIAMTTGQVYVFKDGKFLILYVYERQPGKLLFRTNKNAKDVSYIDYSFFLPKS